MTRYSTAFYAANKDRLNRNTRAYYRRNRAELLRKIAIKMYGATREELLERFGRVCGCCGTADPGKRGWCIDHDHVTGDVRGVLCNCCNTGIGKLGDSLEGLRCAVRYLELAKEKSNAS